MVVCGKCRWCRSRPSPHNRCGRVARRSGGCAGGDRVGGGAIDRADDMEAQEVAQHSVGEVQDRGDLAPVGGFTDHEGIVGVFEDDDFQGAPPAPPFRQKGFCQRVCIPSPYSGRRRSGYPKESFSTIAIGGVSDRPSHPPFPPIVTFPKDTTKGGIPVVGGPDELPD
jgi:hypothetical protein